MATEKAPVFRDKPREKQGGSTHGRGPKSPGARKKRPATKDYLERAGLYYLQRFASSVDNFKEVMRRKVRRRSLPEGVDQETAERWIDDLAARFARAGLLDDNVYASGRAQSMFRKGKSLRAIRQYLRAKGVASSVTEAAIKSLAPQGTDPDVTAAVAFARRRRFGPFRTGPAPDRDQERKILAAFARAGFSYGIARRVLDAESETAAERLAESP